MDQEQVAPGSDEYNQQMADKFANQEQLVDDPSDEVPVSPMPEGGLEKFYDKATGEYNWQNHAKELEYRMNQGKVSDEDKQNVERASTQEVTDIVQRAGLNPDDLRQQLMTNGSLTEEAIASLEKQGLRRELIDLYVDNWNYRVDAQRTAALDYAGGENEWQDLAAWAAQNLPESEVGRYNELLASPEWKVAIDALKVRRGSQNFEPNLVGGSETVSGTSFGYRSKSEMKADMSNPKYASDPSFRKQVMQKIQSATWDMDAM
jgi:hypothetical protein